MLVLVLCQPDAAKKVSLVCPSLVAYPDAMATITVAIFNRRRPHVFRYFRKRRFFLRVSFLSTRKQRFQTTKSRFYKTVPRVELFIKKRRLIAFSKWTDEKGMFLNTMRSYIYSACPVRDDTVVPFLWPFSCGSA